MLLMSLEDRELAGDEVLRVVIEKLVLVDSMPSPVTSAQRLNLVLRGVPESMVNVKDGLKVWLAFIGTLYQVMVSSWTIALAGETLECCMPLGTWKVI